MALSKTDQVRFEGLQQTLSMLQTGGMELAQIKTMMAPQLADFQSVTNHKVNFVETDSGVGFELLNLSRDFVRVRGSDDSKALRTKIQGVPVEVKVFKADAFLFSNEDIVGALRALADEVEALPVEVNTFDITADVRKELAQSDDVEATEEDSVDAEDDEGEFLADEPVSESSEEDEEESSEED